jgi:hypothetical protein
VDFGQLPSQIRVKLTEKDEERLWKKVENETVKAAAEKTGFSASKIYNWKNKDSFIPAEFVKQYLDQVENVEAVKGGGRSKPTKNISFPLEFSDELLTRINCSVTVNKEGVPVYQSDDRGNAARFAELMKEHGIPVEVYNRNYFEVRYPKYIHEIAKKQDYEPGFAAKVDEEGRVQDGFIEIGQEKIDLDEFEAELFSRSKRLSLALQRENSQEIARLMAEESKEIRELIT